MRLLMNAELSTTYAEWKKVYDVHQWARDEANMKEILDGWCDEDKRIYVCFDVESMEVMDKFMEKQQKTKLYWFWRQWLSGKRLSTSLGFSKPYKKTDKFLTQELQGKFDL